jgi:predicted GH43/DUF377 family glycosyl hydrolase
MSSPIDITRLNVCLSRDPRRVITKPFLPGEETFPDGQSRVEVVLRRILSHADDEAVSALESVLRRFGDRHRDLSSVLLRNFQLIADRVPDLPELSDERRLLAGAYFTHEYSIEAAALFNPSMVPAPDQDGAGPGEVRFIMSLRAVGEGHISSIEFRSGTIDGRGEVRIDPTTGFATTGRRRTPSFERDLIRQKLGELGVRNVVSDRIFGRLSASFTMAELERAIECLQKDGFDQTMQGETVHVLHLLANSNYIVAFDEQTTITERVLFPSGPTESHGMEDARFVRFVDDDISAKYYATYTAWDGLNIIPQLIETTDFRSFRVATLNGQAVQNKGMALFPRRIAGRYAMLSRSDRENIDLMFSDRVREWQTSQRLCIPEQAWELIQIGNSGSPIETEAGWLVLIHGVGPMRTYGIGAVLLDLDDPSRVIGRLRDPLLLPGPDERDGYVPNVVYSCGGMVHEQWLFIPYGISDMGARVARVELDQLLEELGFSPCDSC